MSDLAREWWSTSIIEIEPGSISVRGYAIQELIGNASFVDMIWLMTRGELPTRAQSALLEAALVAAVDHGPQAPSIAIARMAMTCGVGINNAVASGLNALGDVHGGAGEQCMSLFYDLASNAESQGKALHDVAEAFVKDAISTRKILPGFGHRFHPTDPRATRLDTLLEDAAAAGHITGRFCRVAKELRAALCRAKNREIALNIDGIMAAVLCELGFEPILGRGLFLISRGVGICSHAYEQSKQGGRIKGPVPPAIGYSYNGPARRHLPSRTP